MDDARAIAVADWDFDGDLDLWISNRTAPRVRFLRNDFPSGSHFLAIRLEGNGKTSNRDAIGARVEVESLQGGKATRHIKTLHAGEGFISQSSKWLHFGLGEADAINRITVRWPDGKVENIESADLDSWNIARQGSGLTRWSPAPFEKTALVASTPSLPTSSEQARIVLPTRLHLPRVEYRNNDGKLVSLQDNTKTPLLINLWASWCAPCMVELADWTSQEEALRGSGLNILTLSLDTLESNPGDPEAASNILNRIKFPFASGFANEHLLQSLDLFQRGVMDHWQQLPVPSSFLIDRRGNVAVIYKGPVESEQVLADMELLELPAEELRDRSVSFPGHWISNLPQADPLRVATQFIDHSMIDEAIDYLELFTAQAEQQKEEAKPRDLGDVYFVLATLLQEQNKIDDAITALKAAVKSNPDDFRVRQSLGKILLKRGQTDAAAKEMSEALRIRPDQIGIAQLLGMISYRNKDFSSAVGYFSRVVQAQPGNVSARVNLAGSLLSDGRTAAAVAQYRQALSEEPNIAIAVNNLAWTLATSSSPEIRNGSEAVQLAERLCKLDPASPSFDTLAASYAEAGRFPEAVRAAQQALTLAKKASNRAKVGPLRTRLQLYKQGKPYHETGVAQ